MVRYVVNASGVFSAANRLATATHQSFERRRSEYWGEYCFFQAFLDLTDLRVFSNADPMYRAHLDSSEENVFESRFAPEQVLIDDARGGDERVEVAIREAFPDVVKIGGAAAE